MEIQEFMEHEIEFWVIRKSIVVIANAMVPDSLYSCAITYIRKEPNMMLVITYSGRAAMMKAMSRI